jgi:hypothetical protein
MYETSSVQIGMGRQGEPTPVQKRCNSLETNTNNELTIKVLVLLGQPHRSPLEMAQRNYMPKKLLEENEERSRNERHGRLCSPPHRPKTL